MVLESFDEASKVGSALKTDTITVVITDILITEEDDILDEAVNQEILATFSETPIEISAAAGVPGQNFYLNDLIKDLESALGVIDLLSKPSLDISLVTEYEFLAQDSLTISISPQPQLEATVYKDANLIITIYGQQVTVPIEVTITACTPDVKFEHSSITEEYVLGSGSKSIQFPSLI